MTNGTGFYFLQPTIFEEIYIMDNKSHSMTYRFDKFFG